MTKAGELYTWGYNRNHELGLGDIMDRILPVRVDTLRHKAVTSIAGGAFHSLAATKDGELYAWWGTNWSWGGKVPKFPPTTFHTSLCRLIFIFFQLCETYAQQI